MGVVFCNNNIDTVIYSGYTINKIYACGGELVYEASPTPPSYKWLATYTGGTTSSAECDASSAITMSEIPTANLESVTIGNCVTSIGGSAFSNYRSLTNINIPDSVTSIDDLAFNNCTSLTSITIPSGVTSIGQLSFMDCSGLTSITVNATTPPALNIMTFDNTNNCPIYVPCDSVDAYKAANNWSTYASRIQPIAGSCAFNGKWLATYADSHTESAECDASSAITGSSSSGEIPRTNLVSVEIGDCVTEIGNKAFYYCRSLTSVTIPNSVTNIGNNSFYGCSGLTSVTIPNSVTSIDYNAFWGCSSLTSIDIPNSVTSIGFWCFLGCSGLTNVTLPSGITSITTSVFQSCSSLISIDIPSGVTSIAAYSFSGCTSLTSITVNAVTPPMLTTSAFDDTNNCPIYVPSGSVDAYKAASGWSTYASRIQAIS